MVNYHTSVAIGRRHHLEVFKTYRVAFEQLTEFVAVFFSKLPICSILGILRNPDDCKNILQKWAVSCSTLMIHVTLAFYCPCYALNSDISTELLKDFHNAGQDSILIQTSDVGCRGTDPILTVSGKNITWYADAGKLKRLAQGNTYHSAALDATTIFYLTQTINGTESSVQAIVIEIVNPFLLEAKITPASCGKKDGTITVIGKGGTARYPLYFQLNDATLQTSPYFSNVSGGNYKLTIGAAGCFGTSNIIVGQEPSPLIAAIDSIAPNCGNTDGSLRITAYGGTGTLSYSLNGIDFIAGNLFENLTGGVYNITVKDQNLCKVSQSVSLKKSIMLKLNTVEAMPTICGKANGQININDAVGNGKLTYSLTGRPEQSASVFDNLEAGIYHLLAKDEFGCRDEQIIEVANSYGPIIKSIEIQNPTCGLSDGRLIVITNDLGKNHISLDGIIYQQDSLFFGLSAGKYIVYVKDDLGCGIQQSINLSGPCSHQFYLTSSFTPNSDGINDGWTIFFQFASLQIEELTLYNRWGEVVFHGNPGTVKSGQILWDGGYKGEILNGFFTYQIRVILSQTQSYMFRGTLLVL